MIKVNELAKELVKKGIAKDSEEASKMAETYIRKEVLPSSPSKSDNDDKVEILFERMQRKINGEIISLKAQLSSVINELNFIKEDIKRMKLGKESRPVYEEIKKPKLPDEKQERLETKEEKKASNQRIGNLKPGDVNIEDYFYYGNKKK